MKPLLPDLGLYTDFYKLTMAQGYFCAGMTEEIACFDYLFRANPFGGGYTIFAGLEDLLDALENLRFGPEELEYLMRQGLRRHFLDWLATFRFSGEVAAVREGDVVFPGEPIVRVCAPVNEAQLVETLLLNLLNFQSLVATKAARVVQAANGRSVVDFGLRRAQGLAAIHGSRAARIGGVEATSNVYSAMRYGLEPSGTMAHSWVQSFADELSAFRKFAEVFPERSILLVDTYDTLRSGVPNAITVAQELARKGHRLVGIRLDSGDLAWLSKQARLRLDAAQLNDVKIFASNQLDEFVVRSLLEQRAPIDGFGVGTSLITGARDGALDGIYKLSQLGDVPRLKISESDAKISLPGRKEVLRYRDRDGCFTADAIVIAGEKTVPQMQHPLFPQMQTSLDPGASEPMLVTVMQNGRRVSTPLDLRQIAAYAQTRLDLLPAEFRRFENPHVYRVGISHKLAEMRAELITQVRGRIQQK